MYEKTTLANGLRIVTASLPHTRSVSIVFFVGAGSRYEPDEVAGISHFVEHMLFKGTERRPTPREIAEAIEGVGGVMNASTDKEVTVYWCKVPSAHFSCALDILADNLRYSRFDPVEIEKERGVIIEELHMVQDNPCDLAGVLIDEVLWPGQPLGRDVAGSEATVRRITRDDLRAYLARQYVPSNTVLAVAGNIAHDQVVAEAERLLGDWADAPAGAWFPATNGQPAPRVALKPKRTEQVHFCLGVLGLSAFHPDRYALDVLNAILGEGMSSRLFLEVREKRGLAYDVHSYVSHFQDTGAAVISAGVEPRKLVPTVEAVLAELERLQDGIPEEEVIKAREFLKGRLQLRMEDTRAVASWLGGQELLRREILTVDDVVQIIDRIEAADLQRVAREVFRRERANLAVVGPARSAERLEALLQ
ncbi:MAG TPA: pitrilysin family protein [Chloroflexota bacterium]|nr:pitrilysin family protein [Chloroflexota bacterium]HZU05847.1 pitrilysin family protein [Chloroflexota bacterium]